MAIDSGVPRSRRALLAGGLGGLGTLVAAGLGRPGAVGATDGEPLLVGQVNTATNQTAIHASGFSALDLQSTGTALYASSTSDHALQVEGGQAGIESRGPQWGVVGISSGIGLLGEGFNDGRGVEGVSWAPGASSYGSGAGVTGWSGSGDAVVGFTESGHAFYGESLTGDAVSAKSVGGAAVFGTSQTGSGVYGDAKGAEAAVLGRADTSSGVMGVSEIAYSLPATAHTGVYGIAAGVAGRGVYGRCDEGRAVYGLTTSGQAVRGLATTGTAGYFATQAPATGMALRAIGRVRFDQCAGIAIVPSGSNAVTVTPGVDLVGTSAVVATLQGNPAGTVAVRSVAVNATADTFRIYLTATAAADLRVAWHVFG